MVIGLRADHDGNGGLVFYTADGWLASEPSPWSLDGGHVLRFEGEAAPPDAELHYAGGRGRADRAQIAVADEELETLET